LSEFNFSFLLKGCLLNNKKLSVFQPCLYINKIRESPIADSQADTAKIKSGSDILTVLDLIKVNPINIKLKPRSIISILSSKVIKLCLLKAVPRRPNKKTWILKDKYTYKFKLM
jgi:hypothetical protein